MDPASRPFHLTRYFSLASGAALLLASLALGFAYYRTEVDEHIAATQAANVTLARVYANSIGPRYAGFLSGPGRKAAGPEFDARADALHRDIGVISRGVPILKIKIYNPAGMAIYSSVPGEAGEDKSANPGFRAALAGRPMSDLTHRGSMSVTEGRVENVDVLSTYIPLLGAEGRATAVFELYTDMTATVADIQADTLRVMFALGAVFAALYGALLVIVRNADRILKRQSAALQDNELQRLKRFFSAPLAEHIAAGGMDDPLKTHRREITSVSIDLRGFTAFTEAAEPEEVIGVLREYHKEMGRVIAKHEGTIEYFAGDGIIVIFNDPVPVPDPAGRAVRMALEMQAAFEPLAHAWRARGFELGLGIGIAQGYATIGAIGFEGRRDYAAIGSVMNLSARLCGEAASGQTLIERKVRAELGNAFAVAAAGELSLKGFVKPVPAYAVAPPAPAKAA